MSPHEPFSSNPMSSAGTHHHSSQTWEKSRTFWLEKGWASCAVLFLLALLVRLADLNQLPRWDELYTVLAARGWLSEGVPRIAEGIYSRAELYTVFIAGWLNLFGDSIIVARLPSVLFGSLLVVAVFLWANAVAGRTAAWISGFLMALDSLGVEMSQYARFYALHALTFWLGVIGVYALATRQVIGTWSKVLISAGTVLSLLVALYLQILTGIGAVGLAVWAVVAALLPGVARWSRSAGKFSTALLALGLVVGVAAAAFLSTDMGRDLLARYQETPLTVIHHEGQFWFYHLHLIEQYPTLWPIFPFLVLIALAARPKPSLFAICVFGVAFALVSFGGQKSWRYLFFVLPFLFVVWAIALARLWDVLRATVLAATDQVARYVGPGWHRSLRWSLLTGGVAFLLLANGSTARTMFRPLGIHLGEGFSAGWPTAVPQLEDLVRAAAVVLTSHELHMLYYLGRADIVLSKERLGEIPDVEFQRDPRTGLPVISRPESLELILACYPTGVLVTDTIKGWRASTVIDDKTANLIVNRMTPIELPERSKLIAFQWQTPVDDAPPEACAAIPGFDAPGGASG